jgi:hypothetical protein
MAMPTGVWDWFLAFLCGGIQQSSQKYLFFLQSPQNLHRLWKAINVALLYHTSGLFNRLPTAGWEVVWRAVDDVTSSGELHRVQ